MIGLVLLGCSDARQATPPLEAPPAFTVDPDQCPELEESSAGKITHEAYLAMHPELTHAVTVKLRELTAPPPPCSGSTDDSVACAERDPALAKRQALSIKQVECVLLRAELTAPRAHWYESLRFQTNGFPAVIGTAFSTRALFSFIELAARHPYVESIEPALGEAAKLGVAPPSVPKECPAATDSPEGKLENFESVIGQGRQPVVLELRVQLLPAYQSCAQGAQKEYCDEFLASGLSRSILGQRMETCVRTYVDNVLQGPTPRVSHSAFDGYPFAPRFAPFDDVIGAVHAFGLGLTLEEVNKIARHPYVDRVWTSETLTFDDPPPGCPSNYDAPANAQECPTTRDSASGKFTSADAQAIWESSNGPHDVLIAVRRENSLCPRPDCPDRAQGCPELDRYTQHLEHEARASQSCVRAFIVTIGGSVSDEVFVLGNGLMATLTWPQIQAVSTHPHVISISSRSGGSPLP